MTSTSVWIIVKVLLGFVFIIRYGDGDSVNVTVKSRDMSIGLIENCTDDVTSDVITAFGYTVHLYGRCADPRELYQMLKAVFSFVEADTDVIVLLVPTANHILLEVNNATVIQWGQGPSYALKLVVEEVTYTDDAGDNLTTVTPADGVTPPVSEPGSSDPYCVLDVDEDLLAQETKRTVIDTVDARGPDILTSLVVKHLHWTSLYIIHEDATEVETTSLVDLLSAEGVLLVIYNMDAATDFRSFLHDVYHADVTSSSGINFLVLCRAACVERVFNIANGFDDTTRKRKPQKTILAQLSRWLAAVYDHTRHVSETLKQAAGYLDNVAIVDLPLCHRGNNQRQNFKTSLTSVLAEYDIREQVSDTWDNSTLHEFVVRNLAKRASSSHTVSVCRGYLMETLMWTVMGREFDTVGFVSVNGHVVVTHDLFPNTKFGYNMRNFLVSTLHYSPFVIKRELNGTAVYEGICFDLLKELASTLNFTYTLTEPPDKKWGSPQGEGKNWTFNGMIGQLQREEVDMVAADISIQKEREMVMDFTFPFFYGQTGVLLRKPDPKKRKWRTLIDPFKVEVLIAIGITLPFVSLVAFLIEKYNPYYTHPVHAKEATEQYGIHTFQDAFWYMYGALLSQGGVNMPDSVAGRTFVSCWWLFSIIIVGTYCGNLIAFLTVSKAKPPFETLEEMAQASDEYKWGVQAGTNWEFVFKTSKLPEFRAIGDKLFEFNKSDPSVLSVDVEDHLRKVRKGGYAWIGDTVIIEVNLAKDCNLMMMKEKFLPLKYAFGFPNNSPHTKIFSNQMILIHESGLLHVWKRRWWPKSSVCAGPIVMEAKPISLIDVQSAFYVAAGGMVIGTLAFIMEILFGKFQEHRRQRNVMTTTPVASRLGTPLCLGQTTL